MNLPPVSPRQHLALSPLLFWLARVPSHVLAEEDYAIAMDPARPQDERRLAFERRSVWLRWLPTGYQTQ
ncbi:hypothetical protein [Streptomyces bobili]|uniref:hypothetical protein n=1 Tax=Streptomyces bobili TaxID=67280 RepID=UPI00371EC4D0